MNFAFFPPRLALRLARSTQLALIFVAVAAGHLQAGPGDPDPPPTGGGTSYTVRFEIIESPPARGVQLPNVLGLSSNGQFMVGDYDDASGFRPFYWSLSTGLVDLVSGPVESSGAMGVSRNGEVICGGNHNPLDSSLIAFRWTRSGGLRPLTSPSRPFVELGHPMSDDGSVIIGNNDGPWRWTPKTDWQRVPVFGGKHWARATAISNDGATLVGYYFMGAAPPAGRRAFRWVEGLTEDLGLLPGCDEAYATAASRDGSVVVGNCSMPGPPSTGPVTIPFRWEAGSGMSVMYSVGWNFTVNAIDDTGTFVAAYAEDPFGDPAGGGAAFYDHTPDHGARFLRPYLVDAYGMGPALAGIRLEGAQAVASDAHYLYLAGLARTPSGMRGFWLRLPLPLRW